jgi:LemA protein
VAIHTKPLMRLLPLVLIPTVLAGCGVNTIPTKQERAKAAWADVQSQYQRRADLVPNLVATVQGYATQEKTVLTEVTQARASATQVKVDASTVTDPAAFQRYSAAQNQLSGVLGRLLAISENYPDLKSNQNFLTLQSQLEGRERLRHHAADPPRVFVGRDLLPLRKADAVVRGERHGAIQPEG